MSSSDYILVTGSRNLNDGSSTSDPAVHEEPDDASIEALEGQGISILKDKDKPATPEPRDSFARELMNEGGIEIISGDGEESYL